MYYVEYEAEDAQQVWPAEGYTDETAVEAFVESLPDEQRDTAVVQYYNPFEWED